MIIPVGTHSPVSLLLAPVRESPGMCTCAFTVLIIASYCASGRQHDVQVRLCSFWIMWLLLHGPFSAAAVAHDADLPADCRSRKSTTLNLLQVLKCIDKDKSGKFTETDLMGVLFVPLKGATASQSKEE